MNEQRFKSRTGIVSGGARRGGCSQAIVRLLANEGAKIVCVDVDEGVIDFAAELRASPVVQKAAGDVRVVVGDLAEFEVAEQAVGCCMGAFGPHVHILVNVAGGSYPTVPTTCHETEPEHYRLLHRKNVESTRNLIAAAAPVMKRGNDRRDIVNFSTTNGSPGWAWAGEPALAQAKAAVEAMTRCWAAELRPFRISVNCIQPASIPNPHSPTWAVRLADLRVQERMCELYPWGPLTAEQVAVEVAHLLDPAAPPRTGQTITLDSGISALGTETPRPDGVWWLPATTHAPSKGNRRVFVQQMVARLNGFIMGVFS